MSDTFIPTPAYLAPVPKTGAGEIDQYELVDGEDGHDDMQKGAAWPEPRFRDNEDGTVTDYLTGLIWLKNANCADSTTTNDDETAWEQAFEWVDELNRDGTMNTQPSGDTSNGGTHQSDWRLPNVRELQSLIDYGQSAPALPGGHPFDNVRSSNYWSSSTVSSNSANGWSVDLNLGHVNTIVKTFDYYVWPVRGGQ